MGGVRLPASLPGFVSPPSFVPHRLHGLCLAPALPRTWSPVKFRAAPWDTCRKPAALQAPCNHGNGGQWEVLTARGGGAYSARGWSGAWRELMGGIWVWFVRHSKADGACGNPQCRGRQPDCVLHHVALMTSFLVLGIASPVNSKVKIQEFCRTRLHATSHPEPWACDQTLLLFSLLVYKPGWCEVPKSPSLARQGPMADAVPSRK